MVNLKTMYGTCDTTGCDNAGHSIRIVTEAGVNVVCGVCDQPITDVTDTPNEQDTEVPAWLK